MAGVSDRSTSTLSAGPPARSRVIPLGDIVSTPPRGAWTGNRGCLHRGTEIVRFHASDLWIVCALDFGGRRSELWRPGSFTWLFFHDEAVAFAGGPRTPRIAMPGRQPVSASPCRPREI